MKCGSCLLSTFESENGSFSFSRYRSKYQALLTRHSGNILVMLLFFPAPLPTFSLSYLTQFASSSVHWRMTMNSCSSCRHFAPGMAKGVPPLRISLGAEDGT